MSSHGQQPKGDYLMRVQEVARALDLSKATIYRYIKAGKLPTVRHGHAIRVPASAVYDLSGPYHPGEPNHLTTT